MPYGVNIFIPGSLILVQNITVCASDLVAIRWTRNLLASQPRQDIIDII